MHTHDLVILGVSALVVLLLLWAAYKVGHQIGTKREIRRDRNMREAQASENLRQVLVQMQEWDHQTAEALKAAFAEIGNMENRRATEAKQIWDRITGDHNGMIDRLCDEIALRRTNQEIDSNQDWHLLVKPLSHLLRLKSPEEAAHSLWLVLRAVRCYNYDARTTTELEKIVQAALNKLRAST